MPSEIPNMAIYTARKWKQHMILKDGVGEKLSKMHSIKVSAAGGAALRRTFHHRAVPISALSSYSETSVPEHKSGGLCSTASVIKSFLGSQRKCSKNLLWHNCTVFRTDDSEHSYARKQSHALERIPDHHRVHTVQDTSVPVP